VFENGAVWGIFRQQTEGTGSCTMRSSTNIIMIKSKKRGQGHTAHKGERRNAYNMLVGKPEENRPLETPRSR
jgi:hypothetical protein